MTLLNAPFAQCLRIVSIDSEESTLLVLRQMGLAAGKLVEKLHAAPLGDPLAVRVGGHRFSLRREICSGIIVEAVEMSA